MRFHLALVARLLTRRYGNPGGYSFHPRLAAKLTEAELEAVSEIFGEVGALVVYGLRA